MKTMKLKNLLLIAVTAITLVSCKDDDSNFIRFSAPNLLFSASGGEKSFDITYNDNWSITVGKESWIESITPMSGKGSARITVKVPENTTEKVREEVIYFGSQSFSIIQQPVINVDPELLIGKWETDAGDFKFTFNNGGTCEAEMTRGGKFSGTYVLVENILTITTTKDDKEVKVIITINSMSEDGKTMNASTMGTSLILKKK